ncbi:LpxL/LpxP family Kdo(2)-lipid IV(A) lauroyl/palmitoleoyl acyltransferase [Marinobacterium sp. AK62]|uniref:Lipid A biosynthesis acyltransferase n=1 Tax=Marinobacterium alkalitolerans TaxID=1542925 RepID=A0ABS3Z682_9GAMM|nr:LpxL/LpxP family Kdo(2)-lipid IV(A) lauroyl/palmitoleoyl acyltransferase [Marinobacterium alkalitolerans]MBP0047200.1 LpxL/LpxP family Kdo(2)-lipid IV(A) lauroyl/palmitoleoyl acyltransferase [Marinobacterium alkalitolerans]
MSQNTSSESYAAPVFWPTWLGIGLLRLLNHLPWRWQISLGRILGHIIYYLSSHRRHVTRVNIRLCFPELDTRAQARMVRQVFVNNGIGLFETAMAWWTPRERLDMKVTLKGREHLDAALAQGKGVVLLGAHFSTLDLGGLLFSNFYPVDAMYRRHNNPLLERIITRGRQRFFDLVIERSNIRTVLKALRQNHIVWYAPDQDFGHRHSVYAPFFGVPAATITATSRMVKLNGSPILMLAQHRLPDYSGYELELFPIITSFPSGDEEADAKRVNQEIERAIRKDPAQYMWVHRRFKTHPQGKNYLYRQR